MSSKEPFPGTAVSLSCCSSLYIFIARRNARKALLLVTALLGLSLFLYSMFNRVTSPYNVHRIPIHEDPSLSVKDISPGQRKLVIILPADRSSPDLCKVISSAVALGYPAPVIVNWKTDFHTEEAGIGPSQLGKITGTLQYLEWATSEEASKDEKLGEDDLVLMLDAHDVWLQLPPSVLLHRYFKANERANKQLAREYGFFDKTVMEQTIIVSAQKGCVAPRDSVSNLHCNDIPESTLPPNVYGFFTDFWKLRWRFMRPRYVNSGSFMGPAGDMRKYFRRVKERMDADVGLLGPDGELGGDQGIFAEVFGEQEVWRQRVRRQHDENDDWKDAAVVQLRDKFEYHIGLDYAQDLFYPTCYAEDDGYFVSLDDSEAVEEESKRLGVWTPRIDGVPSDIQEAKRPLEILMGEIQTNHSWGHVPLYADVWTTAIPVALHHNAWKNGLKSRRATWWDKTWYFPYLRHLLHAHSQPNGTAPLATLPARNESLRIVAYDEKRKFRAPLLFGQHKVKKTWVLRASDWDTVCRNDNEAAEAERHWYDEVFRDRRGPL
ncbi:hypothetical protein B0T10DRAFT_475157 [Thelonectria olida]|uniref:Uncharacterized protein n=1 Tax=Thelonectria olida TaxID=1576542 RepID=A0A9P9AV54_9HYPO|nr:hypothetical protein B0T10DRAFT_475157 [Thelonectria olida]